MKYFFIDYDNTLFSHWTRRIPDSALEALRLLREAGHKIILASGRGFKGDLTSLLGSDFTPDGIAGANGAIIELEGKLLKEIYYDPEVQKRLIDFVMERGYCLLAHYGNQAYTSNLERLLERHDYNPLSSMPLGGDAFLMLRDKPMASFFMDEEEPPLRDVEQNFPELKILRMGAFGGADVIPRENGKDKAMLQILEYYGASRADAVAIGDSMNDMDILKAAGLGIAMGNAMQELKDAADYVAKPIDEDGFLDAVRYALAQPGF